MGSDQRSANDETLLDDNGVSNLSAISGGPDAPATPIQRRE
jgi:hypothetical protein